MSSPRPDPLGVHPPGHPLTGTVGVPGSKSLTNRALVAAALAEGTSTLVGALEADDTAAMTSCLAALGVGIEVDAAGTTIEVAGCEGQPVPSGQRLDARLSGTTSRFVVPVAALAGRPVTIDAAPPMRGRPLGPTLDALRTLGARVEEQGEPGHLPVTVLGPLTGGAIAVPGDASSQFLSGLLLAGPAMPDGLTVTVEGPLVSRPYVAMTEAVMASFGAPVRTDGNGAWSVPAGRYRAGRHRIEPDASAASYLFAAAVLTGGRVTVEGLGRGSLQGDLGFVDVLGSMGARVDMTRTRTTVAGTGTLRGVEVDLSQLSDTAQTLAAVAVFAEGPTRVTGIGFIRDKETDRIAHPVAELVRCGIDATEEPDGFVVRPGTPRPAVIETYDDHRMAMAFALLGLRAPGIAIADPGCVTKTYPGYWDALASLGVRLGGD